MPSKEFMLDEHTPVTIYKRRSSRNLRLTITSKGQVRVSIPSWAPYKSGLDFARARQDWINQQRPHKTLLVDGQQIGKAHRLRLMPEQSATTIKTRLGINDIYVRYPDNIDQASEAVQKAAEKASIRALRAQAENLLPQRLQHLAAVHGLTYTSVRIKQLKGRWGSCDQHQNIVLNLFLMQLPWHHIDYVLLHELTHTQILHHGAEFWALMDSFLSDAKSVRKELRMYQPVLQ